MKMRLLMVTVLGMALSACGKQQPSVYHAFGVEKGAGSVGVHTVLQGDTVYKIAQNYQLPMREIITLNHIQAPYALTAGFRMKLPAPNEHEVKEGDTVMTISRLYETSANRLAKLNNLRTPYRLVAGQKLRLPTPTSAQKITFAEPVRGMQSARGGASASGRTPRYKTGCRKDNITGRKKTDAGHADTKARISKSVCAARKSPSKNFKDNAEAVRE